MVYVDRVHHAESVTPPEPTSSSVPIYCHETRLTVVYV